MYDNVRTPFQPTSRPASLGLGRRLDRPAERPTIGQTAEDRQAVQRSRGGAGMGVLPPTDFATNGSPTSVIRGGMAYGVDSQTTGNSFLHQFGSSMLAGAFGSSLDFAGNLVSSGLQYVTQNRALDIQEQLGKGDLEFRNRAFDTEWNAARGAGLISPSQIAGAGSDRYARSSATGSQLSVARYSAANSIWQ